MTDGAPIPVIVNAVSGGGRRGDDIERLQGCFDAAGAHARILPARNGAELNAIAERAVRERPRVVVAAGGDGTVNCVAAKVAGTTTALGVLPLGTLNHFARDLGIPLDLEAAASAVVHGREVSVDVGEVNGHVFVNNSSLGLYPNIVKQRDNRRRRWGMSKWSALCLSTLTVLRRHPFLEVRLALPDREEVFRTPVVFVGNNAYVTEGFNIGRRERLDGGALSLYVTQRRGRWGLIALALRALVGRLHQARDFQSLSAREATITMRHGVIPVATDGEVSVMRSPLEYRIRAGSLRVLVPV